MFKLTHSDVMGFFLIQLNLKKHSPDYTLLDENDFSLASTFFEQIYIVLRPKGGSIGFVWKKSPQLR